MLVPLVIVTSGTAPIPGEIGVAIWSAFIIGLVLLGMALVGFLMMIRRKMAVIVTMTLVFAMAVSFIMVGKGPRLGLADSVGEAICFFLFSYVLMAFWQISLNGQGRGVLTESAYIDAAIISLVLNITIVNALRFAQGLYPNNLHSMWLVLAFAMVSAVLSLSAIYAKPSDLWEGRPKVKPVGWAFLLGFVLPFLGLLAMFMTQGFSVTS